MMIALLLQHENCRCNHAWPPDRAGLSQVLLRVLPDVLALGQPREELQTLINEMYVL